MKLNDDPLPDQPLPFMAKLERLETIAAECDCSLYDLVREAIEEVYGGKP